MKWPPQHTVNKFVILTGRRFALCERLLYLFRMVHFKTLTDHHRANGFPPPQNPLISLVKCTGTCTNAGVLQSTDFYTIGFKKMKSGTVLYGKTQYDHDQGSMSFIKPRQALGLRNLELEDDAFLILFHEDYLNGHHLHDDIKKYGYFEYETNEALHLSPREEQIIWDLFEKMCIEYNNTQDEYSREIMLTHIDSILKYAQRFYKRQFIDRTQLSGNIVSKFNNKLSGYFESGLLEQQGLPTVKFMASQLNLSSRYLSDLLKQETGKTAMDLIHIYLISEAKNRLKGEDHTVAEIAYNLGFENLPYFSRLFKKEVGISPNQYKKQHLN
jgi:AraC family transcriptional activator of pobA